MTAATDRDDIAVGDRDPRAECRPVGHEPLALGEQVAAAVGPFHRSRDGVRQRRLANRVLVPGALGRPVTETATARRGCR
jgi:hypothetical protein